MSCSAASPAWLAAAWLGCASGPLLAQEIGPGPALEGPGSIQQTVEELEASGFAPTTTVRVQITGAAGALRYGGTAIDAATNAVDGEPLLNALSLNHDVRLTIDTSFTGQDLFRIRLRSGDFAPSGFFSNPPTPLSRLDFAFQEPTCSGGGEGCSGRLVSVNRAYLQFPVTPEIRLSVGARVMQLDMLPVWPSVYNASPILDLFQYAGAPGAYSKRLGGGFGAWWRPGGPLQGLSLGYAYVAGRADDASLAGGLFSPASSSTSTLQLALTRPQWNVTAAYTLSRPPVRLRGTPLTSQLAGEGRDGSLGSWSLAGYWQPRSSGWWPSISAGWSQDSFRFASYAVAGVSGARSRSWYAGLVWNDVLGVGNSLGVALGSPSHLTALRTLSGSAIDDRGLAYEVFYRIAVSDHLTLTPALFWLSRPQGALTGLADVAQALNGPYPPGTETLGVWAGLIRATLRF
ncbi:MAG: hypothetical protein ER33_07790 [Cyanobium sp. CACIAM 14]|nr:MAG: hypothetical protein ER33_07790 [Cyanobium sp. CACIAM 14]